MSRIHDQPDPSVIRKTARSWQPSSRLLDPKNSEAPDITHRSLVDNMLTEAVTSVTSLIDRIEELCPSLPTSVPKGTEEDKIRHVLNHIKGPDPDDPGSTFNRRMDILFGEDCRDDNGRLHHVRRGPWGMKLVVQYFRSIKWATGCVPFTMASIKLTRIVTEMEHLCLNASDVTASAPQTGQASSSKSAGSKRKSAEALSDTEDTPTPKKSKNSSTRNGSVTIEDVDEDDEFDEELSPAARNAQKSKVGDQPSEGDSGTEDEGATTRKKPGAPGSRLGPTRTTKLADRRRNKKKASKGSGSDPTAVGANGMLVDVETPALVEAKKSPTADVQHFSGKPFMSIGQSGIQKPHRKCRLCGDLTVSDPSTFRRHMAKYHNV
ncbi:hypothetical protein B0H10DRAFT_1948076 [Mycena sp. CBHHK59/15]|nr:hypothetical protein B0H10DRAFT_1948076 [Mycena sp. CBHHK59/15]